jgi:hypothetical protein
MQPSIFKSGFASREFMKTVIKETIKNLNDYRQHLIDVTISNYFL